MILYEALKKIKKKNDGAVIESLSVKIKCWEFTGTATPCPRATAHELNIIRMQMIAS